MLIYIAKQIFCIQLNEIEDICEILLSDTRNHTLQMEPLLNI